ncbi:jak pathway signal transduction adaptor molecule [Anaeramoeba flamelloides]|uniref:Jak pathway signal transduction adaptor molecule n=1 Tax=Anaeramoeba flamelloides TaxID=1746091 RepID=A0ABQ8ZAU1_9EUKA|nr:jak pathway signal transduction adaptor molecule [Anaeramoeba flamelloides]
MDRLGIAINNYIGQSENELTFKERDLIMILGQFDDQGGWWQGLTIDSKKGWFPKDYILTFKQYHKQKKIYEFKKKIQDQELPKPKIFGNKLDVVLMNQPSLPNKTRNPLPNIVTDSLVYIRKHCMDLEDLFLHALPDQEIGNLRALYDVQLIKNVDEEFPTNNLHVVPNLLLDYLQKLPSPLLTTNYTKEFLNKQRSNNTYESKLFSIKSLIQLLPIENRDLLKVIMELLHDLVPQITEIQKIIKPNSNNLKISKKSQLSQIFGPILIGSQITKHKNFQDRDVYGESSALCLLLMNEYNYFFAGGESLDSKKGKESSSKKAVRALMDYNADDESELSFKKDQLFFVITKDEDGWWEGKIDEKIGLFQGWMVQELKNIK